MILFLFSNKNSENIVYSLGNENECFDFKRKIYDKIMKIYM